MNPEALATACIIALGLFPLGDLALVLLAQRGVAGALVFFGYLSGYPAGVSVAILSCAAGLAPGIAWLLTATAYGTCLGTCAGLRWSIQTVSRG